MKLTFIFNLNFRLLEFPSEFEWLTFNIIHHDIAEYRSGRVSESFYLLFSSIQLL